MLVVVVLGGYWLLRVPIEIESEYVDLNASSSAMVVGSFIPAQGSVAGGETVLIQGENFPENLEVLFGDRLVTSVERRSDAAIMVGVPEASMAGKVRVTLVAPNGDMVVSASEYEYVE